MDDTRQRLNEEKEDKARRTKGEADELSKELRYTQQVVAGELAGWQELHEKMGRRAVKELVRGMVVLEKTRLEGMRRALRKLRVVPVGIVTGDVVDKIVDESANVSEVAEGST